MINQIRSCLKGNVLREVSEMLRQKIIVTIIWSKVYTIKEMVDYSMRPDV